MSDRPGTQRNDERPTSWPGALVSIVLIVAFSICCFGDRIAAFWTAVTR
jgi:hypothetical protein